MNKLIVIGGGLAGSEAAWQAAERGVSVELYEMRPVANTGAHTSSDLAELVCSNSLGSNLVDRAPGLLKEELRLMGSLLIKVAEMCSVPAGSALAVDRNCFSGRITSIINNHPNIRLIREEVKEIPAHRPTIIASGPLTSSTLSKSIENLTGRDHLYFFDAIAPVVYSESVDMNIAFRGSRYDRGEQVDGDYINCPLSKIDYNHFVKELISAERIQLHTFEQELEQGVRAGMHKFFEGCLPVEILAQRGEKALAFGPMRPVGLTNPHSGNRPYAVVQLRQDNLAATLYNMVGFQTNLLFIEQQRIFRMIPGLKNVEFARFGQMHRNTFVFSPMVLEDNLQYRGESGLFFAGQITGVEGYVGNIATGLLAGWNAANIINGKKLFTFPRTTMAGALTNYIVNASPADFQPMKANFGILPPLESQKVKGKRARASAYAERAVDDLMSFLQQNDPLVQYENEKKAI